MVWNIEGEKKKHVGPPSALDEALAHYCVSREVPGSTQIFKEEVRYLGFVLKKDTRFQTLVGSYILMALA